MERDEEKMSAREGWKDEEKDGCKRRMERDEENWEQRSI